MLTGVSLFAGVGGFDLAMQRQGVKVVASVEIDKNCNQVLAQHFPDATQFTDVTTVKGEDLINAGFTPSTGIITGGFPCQDLSVAGKRAGLAGERSGLFWEIARIVDETQTEYFVCVHQYVPSLCLEWHNTMHHAYSLHHLHRQNQLWFSLWVEQ